ncbi:mutator type transposase [Tanacetum coccineum]|uniref:Mutator type transposase n=1 Tax=Tanacetum coccineum TaxID=301880 RepID=A0ABQ5AS57_9ASTR
MSKKVEIIELSDSSDAVSIEKGIEGSSKPSIPPFGSAIRPRTVPKNLIDWCSLRVQCIIWPFFISQDLQSNGFFAGAVEGVSNVLHATNKFIYLLSVTENGEIGIFGQSKSTPTQLQEPSPRSLSSFTTHAYLVVYAIISIKSQLAVNIDLDKGLAIAMANVFPCAEHRSCLRHIHENMKKQWNGQAYKELLWRCASVTTVPYFDKAMQDLKDFNKECFEWLAKIPPHSWSRSHFSGRAKSDILLNNLCECFNGKILDARDAPIITALEYIREYLMRRMVNVIAVIKKTDGPLTPSATKLLKIAMDRANNCTVAFNGGEEYEVKGQSGSQCVVNVVKKVCSCRKWELTGIPCSHAIAANYNMSLNGVQVGIPEEWVDKCYWLATWQKTYSYTIGCLNGRVMWKKSQIPTTLTPPKHNTPVGRPRKNRRKSKEEKAEMVKDGKLSRAYKTVTCMKCGNLGHNSRSCKGQKDPYTGTSQTTPSTAPAKKPSDAGTRKRPSDAPAPSTAPAKMNQATKKQCAMSN